MKKWIILSVLALAAGAALATVLVPALREAAQAQREYAVKKRKHEYLMALIAAEKGAPPPASPGLTRAAEAEVYAAVGYAYQSGKDGLLPVDKAKALHWVRKAADAGYAPARHWLALPSKQAPPLRIRSYGSGFSPSPHMFVTNHHVVEGCKELEGVYGKHRFKLVLVTVTADQDLALLNSADEAARQVPSLPIAPAYDMKRGEPVYAAGYSGGLLAVKEATVISPHERRGVEMRHADGTRRMTYDFIVMSASTDRGDSGGPIVDATGKVVAVTNAGAKDAAGNNIAGMGVVLGELRKSIAPYVTAFSIKNFSKPDKLSESHKKHLLRGTVKVLCKG